MMGLLGADTLSKYRAYAIVVCAIVGAVLTPSDVFSMFLLMVPLYLLYEISILVIRVIDRRKAKRQRATAA
jgi:sec-independent protein translocase protein TatC